MWLFMLQGIALALPSVFTPSPLKILLISRSLSYGWRDALPITLVPLVTDGPIILLSLFLLRRIPPWYLNGLRLIGGLVILYFAYRLFQPLRHNIATLVTSERAAEQTFRQAIGINMANPNPYLLWGVVAGPIVLDAWRNDSFAAGLGFVAGFYIAFITGLAGLVLVFGTVARISAKANRVINGVAAALLAMLALYQMMAGFSGLLAA
jgi:threonine/homoserine/homoserine lactone efflux protein